VKLRAEIAPPQFLTRHVVAEHTGRTKGDNDALAIRRGRAGAVRVGLVVASAGSPVVPASQRLTPVFLSKQSSTRRAPLSRLWVMNTLSPHTTGVELQGPGSAVFHAMFSVALHFMGKPVSSQVPSLWGPRQEGQLAACAVAAKESARMMAFIGR